MSLGERLTPYPAIGPYDSGRLQVTGGHDIYYEQCGNPAGEPVLIVHGGPGAGSSPAMRRFHDPEHYRIVLFDQRGCGRSTPRASLEHNTTWDLVSDMERLRVLLGIERWQVFGGSWGSTLALAYAMTHGARVTSLILRGLFLLRRRELEWFYQDGCSRIFPEAFDAYRGIIPPDERDDMIGAYHKRLTHPDRTVQSEAAAAWSAWEAATLSLLYDPDRLETFPDDRFAIAFARIECHYFVNRGFFTYDGELLANISCIRHIPAVLVHGRYDVVTPVQTAWDLKQAWPEADLRIVPDAGHAMTEPGIVHELVSATRRFRSSSTPRADAGNFPQLTLPAAGATV